jgi:uncharacterized protein with von Willebrand factor type A (vWA) domain
VRPVTKRPESSPATPAIHDAAVSLGRALRKFGLTTSVDGELAFCRALAEVDITRRPEVYWAAKACFLQRPEQRPVFDRIFDRFWDGRNLLGPEGGVQHGETDPRMAGPQQVGEALPQFQVDGRSGTLVGGGLQRATREVPAGGAGQRGASERRGVLAAYSPADVQTQLEELDYAPEELAAVRRLAADLRRNAPQRRSRRTQASRRGRLDLRRTLRNALRTDGEALRPAYAAPSLKRRRLLFLCDVSGSMDRYSRVLLASMKAAVGPGSKAEAFVFATRLTRLTRKLSEGEAERALERARDCVQDWSGGTRIGEVLSVFNRSWGRRGLARGAIVIVVSDGWDRGDPDQLGRELERLQLQARRLVWVNPRPGTLAAQPLAIGMRTALPHVDDFVPGHDPRAIAGLASVIGGLGAGRPARRGSRGRLVGVPRR